MKEGVSDGLELFYIAWRLIKLIYDPSQPIRLIGISTSHLSRSKPTMRLFSAGGGSASGGKKEQKTASVLNALDKLQNRYGEKAWTRASLIPIIFKERSSGFRYDHEL